MMSCSVAARSGSGTDTGWRPALDVTIVRILTNVAGPVNCRHARSASARHQAHAPDLNVARATTAGYGQSSQFLELLDAAVRSVGFDNSIGGRQVDGCVGQSIWRIGGDSRGVSNCPHDCPCGAPKSASRAYASQLARSVKWKRVKDLRGKSKMSERRISV